MGGGATTRKLTKIRMNLLILIGYDRNKNMRFHIILPPTSSEEVAGKKKIHVSIIANEN